MNPVLDLFINDNFSVINMDRVVSKVQYVPQALGLMQIFDPKPLTGTDKVIVYEEDGTFHLIPSTERYGPDVMQTRDKGRMIALETPRLSKMDSIRASELFRLADTAQPEIVRLRMAGQLVRDRLETLKSDLEMTKEYHRMGALQGKVLDADGTRVIADYFTSFGVAPPTLIDFDFAGLTEDQIAQYIQDTFWRPMIRSLKDRKTPNMRIAALVGDGFWAKLMTHPGFRKIWELEMMARAIARAQNPLQAINAWGEVEFAGVLWINYMGTDDGTTIAVPFDQARFFPIGAKDVFRVYWASGETLLDVNLPGKSEYVYIQPDVRTQQPTHVDVTLRSYPLYACIYPKCLMRARIKP